MCQITRINAKKSKEKSRTNIMINIKVLKLINQNGLVLLIKTPLLKIRLLTSQETNSYTNALYDYAIIFYYIYMYICILCPVFHHTAKAVYQVQHPYYVRSSFDTTRRALIFLGKHWGLFEMGVTWSLKLA